MRAMSPKHSGKKITEIIQNKARMVAKVHMVWDPVTLGVQYEELKQEDVG